MLQRDTNNQSTCNRHGVNIVKISYLSPNKTTLSEKQELLCKSFAA
jgi:transposase